MRLLQVLPFLLATLLVPSTATRAAGDFCSSASFRDAFLTSRQQPDQPAVGQTLLGFGDKAIPCLAAIVEHGGEAAGITECASDPKGCRISALGAIGRIGTPKAKTYLRGFLRGANEPDLLVVAIQWVGNLRDDQARSALVKLLASPNMQVRARSILSLGALRADQDFDKMLAATLSLPPEEIHTGAQGLLTLGDARAIDPLAAHAKTITDPRYRMALDSVVRKLKMKRDARTPHAEPTDPPRPS